MASDETICGREVRAVAAALKGWVDVDAIAEREGLPCPIDQISDEEAVITTTKALWRAALTQTADVTLPLAVGAAIPFGTYDVIDYLASACPTFGAGLSKVGRYFRIITPAIVWSIAEDGSLPAAVLVDEHGAPEERSVFLQYTLGVTFSRFRELSVGDFAFEDVELQLPEPPDRKRHDAFFGCPIRYDAPQTTLRFSRRVWDLSLERREPGLASLLERHAQERLASLAEEEDPLRPVRSAVREQLSDGPPKLEVVAKAVAMSARTLQRRLREAGTSFQALVDEERRSAARVYLGSRELAVADVAYLLGYSEASAFVRAFKRWTGETPKQFRKRGSAVAPTMGT